jgi:hypothetical protein
MLASAACDSSHLLAGCGGDGAVPDAALPDAATRRSRSSPRRARCSSLPRSPSRTRRPRSYYFNVSSRFPGFKPEWKLDFTDAYTSLYELINF